MANITGTTGPDTITPDEVSAGVTGGQPSGEDDNIFGDDGADTINGGKGSDTVDGGDGDDLLISGEDDFGDTDLLSGGIGSDTFQFSGQHREDEILDFTDGVDRIDLSSYRGISFDSLILGTDENSDAVITGYRAAGAEITLRNVSVSDLDESDFIFTDEVSQFPIVSLEAVNLVRDEGDDGTTTAYQYRINRTAVEGGDLGFLTEVTVRIDPGDTDANDWGNGQLPGPADVTFRPGQPFIELGPFNSGDTDFEPDESFTVFIDTVSFGVIDQDAATLDGTMVNDDPDGPVDPPVIGITADPSANQEEGDEGAKDFTFTLTRSGSDAALASESTVVVLFDPRETDAADFVGGLPSPTQIVTFAAGETTQPLTILVAGDTDFENDEAFELELQSRTNGTIFVPATSAEALILNDDEEQAPELPVISITADASANQEEGNDGTTDFTFTVSRTDDSTASAVQVAFDAVDTDEADFSGTLPDPGLVFFDIGELTRDVPIEVAGDTDVEDDESFTVSLIDALGATIDENASSATVHKGSDL